MDYPKLRVFKRDTTDVVEEHNTEITISPNPAADYIEISYPLTEKSGIGSVSPAGGGQGMDIRIFDILGTEITTPSLRDTPPWQGGEKVRMDVSALAPGVYFVKARDVIQKFLKL